MARNLLLRFGERAELRSLQQFDDAYFVLVYEKMLGEELPGRPLMGYSSFKSCIVMAVHCFGHSLACLRFHLS